MPRQHRRRAVFSVIFAGVLIFFMLFGMMTYQAVAQSGRTPTVTPAADAWYQNINSSVEWDLPYFQPGTSSGNANWELPETEFDDEFTPEGRIVPEHGAKLWSRRPDDATEQSEFWDVLQACLENVPEGAREAYIDREIHGQSTKEICDAQGITPNNLWVILHRVRKSLRKCLEIRWFGS